MTRQKSKKKVATVKPDRIDRRRRLARLAADAATRNTLTAVAYLPDGEGIDLIESVRLLRGKVDAAHSGDMRHSEATLVAQADALDAIFHGMAHRAATNLGEHLGAAEVYLRLALRAQSQCRATLETLATIKNPPNVAFVKQANISHGLLQVNNCEPGARMENKSIEQTELLEHYHGGQRLDTGAAGATGRGDQAMATLEAINRPTNRIRKGSVKT